MISFQYPLNSYLFIKLFLIKYIFSVIAVNNSVTTVKLVCRYESKECPNLLTAPVGGLKREGGVGCLTGKYVPDFPRALPLALSFLKSYEKLTQRKLKQCCFARCAIGNPARIKRVQSCTKSN